MAARMYAIDVNYTDFEHNLSVEGESVEFWSRFGSSTLTTIAGAVPVTQTVKGLNAIANGVNLGQSAYSDAFFRKRLIETLIASMRAARNERRAVIRTRMTCSADLYPLGLAFEDVESYYRAGTIETGSMRLTQNVTSDEKKTKSNDDVAGATAPKDAKDKETKAQSATAEADAAKGAAPTACDPMRIASTFEDPPEAFTSLSSSRYASRKPPAVIRANIQPATPHPSAQLSSAKKPDGSSTVQ
jgi:hypothetical protein